MDNISCPACKQEYSEIQEICENCKFPFNGTEKEKSLHIGRFINKKGVIVDSSDAIRRSQLILYAIAGINALFIIVITLTGKIQLFDIALNGILALVFLLCGLFIRQRPMLLTLIPLILILGIYALNFLVDPSSIFKGIIVKLIIIGSLIYSLYLIDRAKRFQSKFGAD
ncbi:hypothetical protein WIW50_14895 [Flavobacteriaceae bacterium 3-367]|uniref:hypothetical protein n=1 Tax=Eudoraea algarum TaxID=3417568 RepID=UPI003295F1F8